MGPANVNIEGNARGREGESTNRGTDEGDLFSVLADGESVKKVFVIQHGSELEDLQIHIAGVLDSCDDSEVGHGRNVVGGSGEKEFETTSGTSRGLGVSTDCGKTKSDER